MIHFSQSTYVRKTQRYFCNNCKKTFIFRKKKKAHYSQAFKQNAVKMYVEQSVSLRALANQKGVSKSSVNNWLKGLKDTVLTPVEVASKLKPTWGSTLLIDAKQMGKKVIMTAVDHKTGDIVLYHLCDSENEKNFREFLLKLKDDLHYCVNVIVSDLGRGNSLPALVREIFPDAHHQICIIHFWRYVCMKIPKSKKSKYYKTNNFLREKIKSLLWAKTKKEARKLLREIVSRPNLIKTSYHATIIKSVEKHFDLLTTHYRFSSIPDNTNLVENFNRQLERRLKTTDNFKSDETFAPFLNLWFIWLRFQPLCNAIKKEKNNRSRLNIAKVNTKNLDWFSFALSKK